jgi:thioredoxin reductase (NADPH)
VEERDVVIIGGGPAGLAAAMFTQPDGWDTLVLEGNWVGGQAAIAYTVMNFPGFPSGDGENLVQNMKGQVTSPPPAGFGAELREEEVIAVEPEKMIVNSNAREYRAKAIILATGSRMQKLGVSGEEEFIGQGVSYFAKRDFQNFKGKRVLVVGGGNSTAKNAILAKGQASEVILIHRRDSLRAYPMMTKRLQKEGIDVWYNTELSEIKGKDQVESVMLLNNKTGEKKEIPVDWVVICVGTVPNTKLAEEAGIELEGGFIKVDSQGMTGRQGIFAAGEAAGSSRHLISSAGDGARVGMAVSEYLAREKLRRGESFSGAIHGKYADEY